MLVDSARPVSRRYLLRRAACGFGFADGHAEIHKWFENQTCAPVTQNSHGSFAAALNSRDLKWTLAHATAPVR